jgi:acyl-ACP thioesterase
MKNMNIDRFQFCAESFLTDSLGRVRATTLLNRMLGAVNRHSETRGFGSTATLGWVIVRMGVNIARTPMLKEMLTIETWVRNLYYGFTDRCVRILDEEGKEIASMIATFALIDLNTRSAVELDGDFGIAISRCIVPDEELTLKRIPPINRTNVELVTFRRRPHYSDIDINGHMNSIRYIDHILDALPVEYMNSHDVTDIVVAYIKEGGRNEELAYSIKKLDSKRFVVQVSKEDGTTASRFEFKFKERV